MGTRLYVVGHRHDPHAGSDRTNQVFPFIGVERSESRSISCYSGFDFLSPAPQLPTADSCSGGWPCCGRFLPSVTSGQRAYSRQMVHKRSVHQPPLPSNSPIAGGVGSKSIIVVITEGRTYECFHASFCCVKPLLGANSSSHQFGEIDIPIPNTHVILGLFALDQLPRC